MRKRTLKRIFKKVLSLLNDSDSKVRKNTPKGKINNDIHEKEDEEEEIIKQQTSGKSEKREIRKNG